MSRMVGGVLLAVVCLVVASACSGSAGGSSATHSALVSSPAPGGHVSLVAVLGSVGAGWCVAVSYGTPGQGSSGCGGGRTSTGPIFATVGCEGSESRTFIFVLATSEVAAVAVDGGAPIATFSNTTLPDGLRAAAVEVRGHEVHPKPGVRLSCPKLTPLDASGAPILRRGRRGAPLFVRFPRRRWEEPRHPPRGVCQIAAAGLPPGIVSAEGEVASRIRAVHGLLGRAFLTCASSLYVYEEEHHLHSALLLDASHPGARPSPIPGMRPLAGHPGVFVAPGAEGDRVARRVPGGWLVVEEEDGIGIRVPLELLEHLRATIRL
jgi:hypothetical protein